MRITASHIIEWVNTDAKVAQTHLPLWVRRLCFDPEMTHQCSFPAGDSTYVPGWDGVLYREKGDAWAPGGSSRWEIGCDQDIPRKANKEYQNRTKQTDEGERSQCTFVFVTPRRWNDKRNWMKEQCAKGEWKDVRAYDADDLEQWLDQKPAVALQFAEELGLAGWGVISLTSYWDLWSRQCDPAITSDALIMDRPTVCDFLNKRIQTIASESASFRPLAIRADSVEEAAAFAVAVVMASGNLQDQALVVTEPEGWRYVEANSQLRIAIAARTEIASNPSIRTGLIVVIPYAAGDSAGNRNGDEIILQRPNIYEFEKALVGIGMDESDARRYALSTGRSWTVFRRQKAMNPAIQRPAWMNVPQSTSLPLLCLLGAWNADKTVDRQIVEQLSAKPYEEIERDLRQLSLLDDSPVLSIGTVWKAKSPLELFVQCGDRITSDQLDRFFAIARDMLSLPDPKLDLPDEQRWMAQVYGKVHPYSGLLFDSVCDSLMKLAVRGPELPGLSSLNIDARVAALVHELLDGADGRRWLSLASYLPTLAEAAPDAFLQAVEKNLRLPDAPVTQLITETTSSGFGGNCWHAGLLWAMEVLAWAPSRLARVALILAQLSHVPMKGNWSNTPTCSLLGLFRSWFPQTAATISERIKVLNLLIQRDEEAAFHVLMRLASNGPDSASPANRPKWREDDAGAGHGVTYAEMNQLLAFAKEKLLQISEGNASRIATLLQDSKLSRLEELPKVLVMMEPFTQVSSNDEDREILRSSLRRIIHWHRNYDEAPTSELDERLRPVEECYARLAPQNLVTRHRWLFDSYWLNLPSRDREEDTEVTYEHHMLLRTTAITEIYQAQGIGGIENLIALSAEPRIVGAILARIGWEDVNWPEWFVTKGEDFAPDLHMVWCINGFLESASSPASSELLLKVIALSKQRDWDAQKLAKFFVLAKFEPETWQLAEACGQEVYDAYWQSLQTPVCSNKEHLAFVVERLLYVKRPNTALQYCRTSIREMPPPLLFSALQMILLGEEVGGPKLEYWRLEMILERLEKSDEIEKTALVQLEFGLFPALGYGHEAKAAVLYEAIMSEPSLFTELICFLSKPEHGECEKPTETTRFLANRAYEILEACKRLPGTKTDGSIDDMLFTQFIGATRELCRQSDRQTKGDYILGKILAHSPADADGTWPFAPARELLDLPESDEIRQGFCSGTFSKRGVTTRSPWDGGGQERDLAAYYRDQAERVHCSHPNVSAMLEEIAKNYEHHGKREDVEANLRKEGF